MNFEVQKRVQEKLMRELGQEIRQALSDPQVVEIMLNPDGNLWVERAGEKMKPIGTMSAISAMSLMGTIASLFNTIITPEKPILECEIPPYGSRFEGLVPPIVPAPSFAIRKRSEVVFTLDDYVSSGVMTKDQKLEILYAIEKKQNILIVGGTGSGKTTLTNGIIAEIVEMHPSSRIIIIEDTPEVQCSAKNSINLRTSSSTDMRELLRATLRLRPDRILVGEVRGGEALSLLKAWNTGHPGGVATAHANNAKAGLIRLEQLIGEVSEKPMQMLIAEAVNFIVVIERTKEGRKVKEVCQVGSTYPGDYQISRLA